MNSTVQYLYRTARMLLGCTDRTMEAAFPYPVLSIAPSPPPSSSFDEAAVATVMAPVSKMLEVADLKCGHLTGKDFASEGVYFRFGHKESCPNDCQEDHESERALDHPNFKQYELEIGSAQRWAWGAGEIPLNLPHYIHRGILMESMCEVLVFALKRSAERLFALIDPKATVQWLWVIPRRRLQFTFPDSRVPLIHSVLLITSPLAGKFVLDPSAEQYGIPPEHRFIRWQYYRDQYVLRKEQHYGTQVWMVAHNGDQDLEDSTGSTAKFWRKVREELETSVDMWLGRVTARGGLTLKEGLDKEENAKEQAEWVANNVWKNVDALEQVSYF